ncbi:hypothetical protein LXA43DRAFT_478404 [Ganoderma leucocontextum]|nr:hypothetical protein LXA43DRAFT_478404 [Ganoderma leucocontextum]
MVSYHPPHNLEVLRTWGLRLGHYMFRSDRVGEGRVGVLMDGTFIPFPVLEQSSTPFPATGTGREFNEVLVDPPRNPEKAFEQDDTLADTDFGGALSLHGASPDNDNDDDNERVVYSSGKSCAEDATANHHATVSYDDRIHVNALLSYLAFHKHIVEIADSFGIETAKHGDIRRGSIVIITQVSTIEGGRVEGILRQPLPNQPPIAYGPFKETSRGSSHFPSIPSENDMGRHALGDSVSEVTLCSGDVGPVFRSPRACQDEVNDTKPEPVPTEVRHPALAEHAMVTSTSKTAPPISAMFIHYARAMERPSIWRRGVDAARLVVEVMGYAVNVAQYWFIRSKRVVLGEELRGLSPPFTFEEDYFPLDELLKHMLAVSCADVAVASTMQLLEIFADEDEMPSEAKDLRRVLRSIQPTVIVEKRYDSSGRRRRVALLSRSPSDTASTVSDETLYPMNVASKSEKWDDPGGDGCTEIDTATHV